MIGAGIVLFNPDINRLKENLDVICSQVDNIFLIDNGSSNIESIDNLIRKYGNIIIVRNNANFGVAKALNQIVENAEIYGAKWVLTLDQDSVCGPSLIEEYESRTFDEKVASLTCRITDRNFEYTQNENPEETYVDSCITSGNYIRVSTWKALGGFDEKLFIDKVDTDYCFRLVHAGYKILQIPYHGILHEVGSNTKQKRIFGKTITIFNHSPFRVYYLIRNQIYFARKHRNILGENAYHRWARTAWTRIFVYLLYENQKIEKLKAWRKGLEDGYKMPLES